MYLTTRRYMSNSPRPVLQWRVPETDAEWQIWLIAAAEIGDYKFFGSYVDLCNPDATRFFLETTHQRYLERLNPAQFGQLAAYLVTDPAIWDRPGTPGFPSSLFRAFMERAFRVQHQGERTDHNS